MNKKVLRRDLKAVLIAMALIYFGSAFHRVGPATPKALLRITVDLKGTDVEQVVTLRQTTRDIPAHPSNVRTLTICRVSYKDDRLLLCEHILVGDHRATWLTHKGDDCVSTFWLGIIEPRGLHTKEMQACYINSKLYTINKPCMYVQCFYVQDMVFMQIDGRKYHCPISFPL